MKGVRSENFSLVEELVRIENDYLHNNISRTDVIILFKRLKHEYMSLLANSESTMRKYLHSVSFLLLDRFKKIFAFEDYVLYLVDLKMSACFESIKNTKKMYNGKNGEYDITMNFLSPKHVPNIPNEFSSSIDIPQAKRANYPKEVSTMLKFWLKENINNPYPSENEKVLFIELTGLTSIQVNNWFINARRRMLPFWRKLKKADDYVF